MRYPPIVWQLEFTREAARALLRMPKDQALRIRRKLDDLARSPQTAANVKKLTEDPGYRMRVGDWRVVYLLDHGRIVVCVIRIAKRSEAYR
jgi:mRNA interferase RelE/StbE